MNDQPHPNGNRNQTLTKDPETGIAPISRWGPECSRGFVRNAMFGSGRVIKGTNRNKSRANRRLVDWQGAK